MYFHNVNYGIDFGLVGFSQRAISYGFLEYQLRQYMSTGCIVVFGIPDRWAGKPTLYY